MFAHFCFAQTFAQIFPLTARVPASFYSPLARSAQFQRCSSRSHSQATSTSRSQPRTSGQAQAHQISRRASSQRNENEGREVIDRCMGDRIDFDRFLRGFLMQIFTSYRLSGPKSAPSPPRNLTTAQDAEHKKAHITSHTNPAATMSTKRASTFPLPTHGKDK